MAGKPPNRSELVSFNISVPRQTHAYLVKLATVGALGPTETAIAAQIVIAEVERLMLGRRAETALARPAEPPDEDG